MPRVGKKLEVVSETCENQVNEKPVESITDAQKLTTIKEEIENNEKMRIKHKRKYKK
jgi:hypothetical protein